MKLKTYFVGVTAAALMAGAALAADVKVGATVNDTTGAVVGTIESVSGDVAVLSTGANKVSLPLSSFGQGDKGPIIAMSRAQIDAAAAGAKAGAEAQLKAQLVKGATVYGTGDQVIGTIDAVDPKFVTVAVDDQKAMLPIESFAKGEKGPSIAMSADELKAAVKGSAQSAQANSDVSSKN